VVYLCPAGHLSAVPLPEADGGPLHRGTAAGAGGDCALCPHPPAGAQRSPAMEIYLFGPLMEGCLGYFLLGYWLGRHPLHRRVRYFLYALGIAGYLAGTVGNLMAASPQEISLPLDGGYSLQHYLTSSAVFVWVRTFA